jgi:phenylalanyl-tRNA synthetase beta chain
MAVLAKIVDDVKDIVGGQVAGALVDDNHLDPEVMSRNTIYAPVHVSADFINSRLGLSLSPEEIVKLLENVEFQMQQNGDELIVSAPFWRMDIAIPEDIVEEVGRLYGYDQLPLVLPKRDLVPAQKDAGFELKKRIRTHLSRAGANEVLTYNFVHGNLLQKVGQDMSQAFQLSNALSPDLQYYRLSLLPSLLDKVHPNIKAGYPEFGLFEINKVSSKGIVDDEGLPIERMRLAFVCAVEPKTASEKYAGAPYYQARQYLARLMESLGMDKKLVYEPLDPSKYDAQTMQEITVFEPKRSATVRIDNYVLGQIGEFKASIQKGLKLPNYTAGFEIDVDVLAQFAAEKQYARMSRFPKIEQDVCLRVPVATTYQTVYQNLDTAIAVHKPADMSYVLSPIDVYQREDDQEHKQITIRVAIMSYERTLTDQEVAIVLDAAANVLHESLQADRV